MVNSFISSYCYSVKPSEFLQEEFELPKIAKWQFSQLISKFDLNAFRASKTSKLLSVLEYALKNCKSTVFFNP